MAEAQRTLVKSPPEIWAEVSDVEALTRHLGVFGEIRITRAEPESTVAWEGTRARGTVELTPAGWGTKVTVTAEEVAPEPEPVSEPEPEPEPDPVAAAPAPVPERRRFWARFRRRREAPAEPAPTLAAELDAVIEPEPQLQPDPEPDPAVELAVLEEMLASLGAAHHRPFSRG